MGTVILVTFPTVGTSSKCGPYLFRRTEQWFQCKCASAFTCRCTHVVGDNIDGDTNKGGNNRINAIAWYGGGGRTYSFKLSKRIYTAVVVVGVVNVVSISVSTQIV